MSDAANGGLAHPPARRRLLIILIGVLLVIVLISCLFPVLTSVFFPRYEILGPSMGETFEPGQIAILSKLAYNSDQPQRGDVIVFHVPDRPDQTSMKRIVGLPGETITIEDGSVYINGALLNEPYLFGPTNAGPDSWDIPEKHYFVMGDNRPSSADSRSWGVLSEESIIGRAVMICESVTDCRPLPRPDVEIVD